MTRLERNHVVVTVVLETSFWSIFTIPAGQQVSKTLRIVRIGDYEDCACIGAHVGNTSEIGAFRIISHDFNDGVWRVRWKVIAKQ